MVIEYTAHADDEVRYKSVPYRPPGIDPQTDASVNVTVGFANLAISTTIPLPESEWFFFNLGTGGAFGVNGEWHRVRTSQLAGLTAGVVGFAPSVANSLKFSDIAAGDNIDVWLMHDANDILLIAMSATGEAPMPFAIAV